jgi:hypothetical protein
VPVASDNSDNNEELGGSESGSEGDTESEGEEEAELPRPSSVGGSPGALLGTSSVRLK